MADRKNRESNIELLRIIAAFGVVVLHYNNANLGGGFEFVPDGSANQFILTVLEALFICAVNLFVMISGYFLRASQKRDLFKPLSVLCQTLFFGILVYFAGLKVRGLGFELDTLLSLFSIYWFAFVYVALYVISPYLNIVWDNLSEKGRKGLLALLIATFSVYPILLDVLSFWSGRKFGAVSTVGLDGAASGYTIVNFVIMYFLGCCARDDKKEHKNTSLALMLVLDVALIVAWIYVEHLISGKEIMSSTAINYENPLVILEAVLVFMLFKNMKLKPNRVINELSVASFTVYLIHICFLEFAGIEKFVQKSAPELIIHVILTGIIIYMAVYLVYKVYSLIASPISKWVSSSWQKFRFYDGTNGFQN